LKGYQTFKGEKQMADNSNPIKETPRSNEAPEQVKDYSKPPRMVRMKKLTKPGAMDDDAAERIRKRKEMLKEFLNS
jgi:hypothetical protein